MTFEEGLQARLDSDTKFRKSTAGKQAARVLRASPARKAKALARMEQHARVHLAMPQDADVDWGAKSIDWNSIIAMLMQLLPLILKLFGI